MVEGKRDWRGDVVEGETSSCYLLQQVVDVSLSQREVYHKLDFLYGP